MYDNTIYDSKCDAVTTIQTRFSILKLDAIAITELNFVSESAALFGDRVKVGCSGG